MKRTAVTADTHALRGEIVTLPKLPVHFVDAESLRVELTADPLLHL